MERIQLCKGISEIVNRAVKLLFREKQSGAVVNWENVEVPTDETSMMS
jgi:hypothetical protein